MHGEFVSRKGNGCPLYVTCEVHIFCRASLVTLLLWAALEIAHLDKLKAKPPQSLQPLIIYFVC